jgi:hypothetical protein
MRIEMFKVKKTRPQLHLFARTSRELALAFALGGVPVLLNSESSAQFKAMLDLLLAAPFLMGYYAWLCLAFAVAAIVKYKWRFMIQSKQQPVNSSEKWEHFAVNKHLWGLVQPLSGIQRSLHIKGKLHLPAGCTGLHREEYPLLEPVPHK